MAILMAFGEPTVEIIGLTTIFGNILTTIFGLFDLWRCFFMFSHCFANSVWVLKEQCERAGHPEVPVAKGSPEPLKGGTPRVADVVHGSDGVGNLFLPSPSAKKVEESAAEFLVNQVSQFPGEVTVLALGPLTNVALAIKSDSSFANNVKKIVVLGGAFFTAGNVNPVAEANIYGDPDAVDIVFTSGADIVVVGINITTQVCLTDEDLLDLKNSKGKHIQFLSDMCKFYRDWHAESDGFHGLYLSLDVPTFRRAPGGREEPARSAANGELPQFRPFYCSRGKVETVRERKRACSIVCCLSLFSAQWSWYCYETIILLCLTELYKFYQPTNIR